MQLITLIFILTKVFLVDACKVLKKSASLPHFDPDAFVRTLAALALKASPNVSAEGKKHRGAQ